MALLTKYELRNAKLPSGAITTSKCDKCFRPLYGIMAVYRLPPSKFDDSEETEDRLACSQDCRNALLHETKKDWIRRLQEMKDREQAAKDKAKDKKHHKKDESDESGSNASASAADESDGSEETDGSGEDAEDASDASDDSGSKKAKKDKKEHKVKKDKSSSKKSSKKSSKGDKKSSSKKAERSSSGPRNAGGKYKAGSAIAIVYDKLSDGKPHKKSDVAKKIEVSLAIPLKRLAIHGSRDKSWKVIQDDDKVQLKMLK